MWRPWKSETRDFLVLLRRSGLLDKAGIRKARKLYRLDAVGESELDKLCSHLVANGILTEWQCGKLRKGRWKGFFLDNYMIMDHIGKDENRAYYLAEDSETGRLVSMAVTPPNRVQGPDGKVHYSVTEFSEDEPP
jgi:hypothetical protein